MYSEDRKTGPRLVLLSHPSYQPTYFNPRTPLQTATKKARAIIALQQPLGLVNSEAKYYTFYFYFL